MTPETLVVGVGARGLVNWEPATENSCWQALFLGSRTQPVSRGLHGMAERTRLHGQRRLPPPTPAGNKSSAGVLTALAFAPINSSCC